MRRPLLLALAALALLPAAPARATLVPPAFGGLSSQGRPVEVASDDAGLARGVAVTWRARCPGGAPLRAQTTGWNLESEPPAASVALTQRVVFADRGGRIATGRVRVAGRLHGGPDRRAHQRWEGTLSARVRVERHGRFAGRCAVRARWLARPLGIGSGRWTVDEGLGRMRTFDAQNATMDARAYRARYTNTGGRGNRVAIVVEDREGMYWTADFDSGSDNRLRPGRRYVDDGRFPLTPEQWITTDRDRCYTGTFSVRRLVLDRLRRLMAFAVDFEQACEDGPAPVRGTIEWRAAA